MTDDAALVAELRRIHPVMAEPGTGKYTRLLDLAEEAIRLREAPLVKLNARLDIEARRLRTEVEKLRAVRDASLAARLMNTDEAIAILDAALDAAKEKP